MAQGPHGLLHGLRARSRRRCEATCGRAAGSAQRALDGPGAHGGRGHARRARARAAGAGAGGAVPRWRERGAGAPAARDCAAGLHRRLREAQHGAQCAGAVHHGALSVPQVRLPVAAPLLGGHHRCNRRPPGHGSARVAQGPAAVARCGRAPAVSRVPRHATPRPHHDALRRVLLRTRAHHTQLRRGGGQPLRCAGGVEPGPWRRAAARVGRGAHGLPLH